MRILLTDAFVYQEGSFARCDVAINQQRIEAISPNISRTGYRVFPFHNCYIIPGLFDVHVHLREPGFSYKETIASGTRAAARGGYTAVCSMPNVNPAPDSLAHLQQQLDLIQKNARVRVYPYATITAGGQGTRLVDMEALAPHVIGFSDDGRGVQDGGQMREAMQRVVAVGSLIAAHCEDESLLNGGYIHDGAYARARGHKGISSASEYAQVERDLQLVRDTGCRYHVCHVSTKESVALIRAAKRDGLPVTCETAPHYLLLCEDDVQEDGRFKMNPPLRAKEDREALRAGLLDGTIDVIATDHAPHAAHEKSKGLRDSLMGIVGLETAFRVLYTTFVHMGMFPLEFLVEKMAVAPRRIFGVGGELAAGQPADLTVLDLGKAEAVCPEQFLSMGRSTPFAGMRTVGDVVMTVAQGDVVYHASR